MFSMFLKDMPNFMSIGCYLLFDPKPHLLCIIFEYKNVKFKHLINQITIDF